MPKTLALTPELLGYVDEAIPFEVNFSSGDCTGSRDNTFLKWEAASGGGSGDLELTWEFCGSVFPGPGYLYITSPPPIGRATWVGTGKNLCNNSPVPTNSPVTDFRAASYGSTTAARSAGKVAVTVKANRLWTFTGKWGQWNSGKGQIQYRTSPNSAWQPLKNVDTRSGSYTYQYTTSSRRSYRVVMASTPTIWGFSSTATPTV